MKDFKTFLNENRAITLSNLEIYLGKMKRGLEDKIFFLDKIDIDCLVDYGCADGFILKQIRKFHPQMKLIGYDYDKVMLNAITEGDGIQFTDKWLDVENEIKKYNKPAILLSSVIHEVYSYGNENDVNIFWKNVFSDNFKYIIIRDMTYSENFPKFSQQDIDKIISHSNRKQLDTYERVWGPIDYSYVNTLHWLLKYSYVENWNRELHENYFPISIEELRDKKPNNWEIIFEDFHILGHTQRKLKSEMDIDIKYPTHIKIIFKNDFF